MKKIIWLVILALVLYEGFVASALPGQGASSPDIEFSEELWDFGTIKQGEKVTHVFEVKNLGGTELVISKVRPSCGCTAALLSSPEVPPGGTSQIEVTFNSSGFKGKVTKYIYVESNDPDEPRAKLTITATVEVPSKLVESKPELTIFPIFLNLRTIKQGQKCTRIIKLKNWGEKKIKIVNVNSSSKLITVNPSSVEIGAGEEAKINVSLDIGEETGKIQEYLYLTIAIPLEAVIEER
mgnify:CR=1 FL=1